ncbi:Holliday junction branch migration protein RuvA [Limosilactobacillus sp.]|uniref:Holliday junction branch migration protein RuvA n=1 Tax=Limosilactobacillus sp. TaxID=2773925 RepID=UPI00345E8FD5
MYEYLTGLVTVVQPNYIVVDVNGVGYRLLCANPYRYHVDQTKRVRVYVYQAVRDDDISLYGFADSDEKELFIQLLGVSGIGPKSALAILANPDHQGLIDAIADDDVSYLTKFPGIGKKTAGQIVLDLRDSIQKKPTGPLLSLNSQPTKTDNPALDDALAALKALGYKEREVKKLAKQLMKTDAKTTDDYLRAGLKLISQ